MWTGSPGKSCGICGGGSQPKETPAYRKRPNRVFTLPHQSPTGTPHWSPAITQKTRGLTDVTLTEYHAGGKGWKGDSERQSDVQPTGVMVTFKQSLCSGSLFAHD